MKRKLVIAMLLACLAGWAQAQERPVTGVATDAANGKPLPLANVQVKGANDGTVTDSEGRFTLVVPGP